MKSDIFNLLLFLLQIFPRVSVVAHILVGAVWSARRKKVTLTKRAEVRRSVGHPWTGCWLLCNDKYLVSLTQTRRYEPALNRAEVPLKMSMSFIAWELCVEVKTKLRRRVVELVPNRMNPGVSRIRSVRNPSKLR